MNMALLLFFFIYFSYFDLHYQSITRMLPEYYQSNEPQRSRIRERSFRHVRPAKIQISLRIRAVWSESSLCAFWIVNNAKILHADNEHSDQIDLSG